MNKNQIQINMCIIYVIKKIAGKFSGIRSARKEQNGKMGEQGGCQQTTPGQFE